MDVDNYMRVYFVVLQRSATGGTALTTCVGRSPATPRSTQCFDLTRGPRNVLSEVVHLSPLHTTGVTENAAALCPGWTPVQTSHGCCSATRPAPTSLALRAQVSSTRKSIRSVELNFRMACDVFTESGHIVSNGPFIGNSACPCLAVCWYLQGMTFRSLYCFIQQFLSHSQQKVAKNIHLIDSPYLPFFLLVCNNLKIT